MYIFFVNELLVKVAVPVCVASPAVSTRKMDASCSICTKNAQKTKKLLKEIDKYYRRCYNYSIKEKAR